MAIRLKTAQDVDRYLHRYFNVQGSYHINDDLSVSVDGQVMQLRNAKKIAIKFQSLIRFVSSYEDLQDFSCLPEQEFEFVGVTYYSNMPMLRLLYAKKIQLGFQPFRENNTHYHQQYDDAERIMAKYQGQGRSGSLACGAELANAGIKDSARW